MPKCHICKEVWDYPEVSYSTGLRYHKRDKHPELLTNQSQPNIDSVNGISALEDIRSLESQIRQKVKDLEHERILCSNRLRELDDLIAKYKKF